MDNDVLHMTGANVEISKWIKKRSGKVVPLDPAATHVDSGALDGDSVLRSELMEKYRSGDPKTRREAYEELHRRGWI
ncbi:hypothetical protein A2572_01765 [Candidatus Collierbacteria bacterium RIFOXYD1_FULL_40_9]|uniref:Uncharacterized protein n=1 Tax=Candidatus Collierbacteria bacterium RIFOXYD1_FULL_40_9 TaxID=1817731 RepID=A0A1F5FUJ4_9BACT|nr:MAG: hypothetical protein A2572_01765 [Candidatus Collierbacteria bacterium RIFOXYD1_FULL_40_9]